MLFELAGSNPVLSDQWLNVILYRVIMTLLKSPVTRIFDTTRERRDDNGVPNSTVPQTRFPPSNPSIPKEKSYKAASYLHESLAWKFDHKEQDHCQPEHAFTETL